MNKLTTHPDREAKSVSVREALEKTVFVGRHNMYTKPKVALRDVELPPDLQKEFENLKEEYKRHILDRPLRHWYYRPVQDDD